MKRKWIILALIIGFPISIWLIHKQQLKEAEAALKIKALIEHGKLMLQAKRDSLAYQKFQAAYELDSNNIDVLVYLGILKLNVGAFEESKAYSLKALKLDPNNHFAFVNLATYHAIQYNYPEAISYYGLAIKNKPNFGETSIDVYFNRGNALLYTSNYANALKDFEKVISLNPRHTYAQSTLVFLYAIEGRKEEAQKAIDSLKTYNNLDQVAYNNISFALNILGQHTEAYHYADLGIEIDSTAGILYRQRGSASLQLGKLESAKSDLDKSLSLFPNNAYAVKDLALYYQARNQSDSVCFTLANIETLSYYKEVVEEVAELRIKLCK